MKNSLVTLLSLGIIASVVAAPRSSDLSVEYLNSEQAMREDEYANSLARRDWLKNRLVLQLGTGSKVASYGEPGMFKNYGIGAEYIAGIPVGRMVLHPSLFVGYGWLPELSDMAFDGVVHTPPLQSGTAWRVGFGFYFFEKLPLHLALSISYSNAAYYDHEKTDDANSHAFISPEGASDGYRSIIKASGWNFDAAVVALTNSWYYLAFNVGMSYTAKAGTETGFDFPDESAANPSLYRISSGDVVSRVIREDGIKQWNPSVGLTVGFALPELFPDDTEVRRREREQARAKHRL